MNKEDIIELWKSCELNGLGDYVYYMSTDKHEKYYDLLKEKLDPDKINPKEFWKATDIHFGIDTVCNTTNRDKRLEDVDSIISANKANHALSVGTGMMGFMEVVRDNCNSKFGHTSIAEIGCGFGAFKEHGAKSTDIYYGFDIIPRYDWVIELEGETGCFSDDQMKTFSGMFNVVYTMNVFQHLSKKQVEKYVEQVYELLPLGGYLAMGYAFNKTHPSTYHYGQVVELFPIEELRRMVNNKGFSLVVESTMYNSILNPYCSVWQKRK
jgi:hypothetical protein